jgi:hypothetical protein
MIEMRNYDYEELKGKVYDLINSTTIQLGHRTDAETMSLLAKTFTADLMSERLFKRLLFSDVEKAFYNGIRHEDKDFISIPTFYKWTRAVKVLVDAATYSVETCNQPPERVQLYRPRTKGLVSVQDQFKAQMKLIEKRKNKEL